MMYKRKNTIYILHEYQFGFWQNNSTPCGLMVIIDNIYNDMEKRKYVARLWLDMSKAFDTVNHITLVDTLRLLCCQRPSTRLVWKLLDI